MRAAVQDERRRQQPVGFNTYLNLVPQGIAQRKQRKEMQIGECRTWLSSFNDARIRYYSDWISAHLVLSRSSTSLVSGSQNQYLIYLLTYRL